MVRILTVERKRGVTGTFRLLTDSARAPGEESKRSSYLFRLRPPRCGWRGRLFWFTTIKSIRAVSNIEHADGTFMRMMSPWGSKPRLYFVGTLSFGRTVLKRMCGGLAVSRRSHYETRHDRIDIIVGPFVPGLYRICDGDEPVPRSLARSDRSSAKTDSPITGAPYAEIAGPNASSL